MAPKRETDRRKAGTRSWLEAEEAKRRLEEKLTGKHPAKTVAKRLLIADAVDTFMKAKGNAGLEPPTLAKLQKTMDRVREFGEGSGLLMLGEVNLTHVSACPWDRYLTTTHSLRANQERVKAFFRTFHNAGVIAKNPAAAWQRVKGKTEQVSGFTPAEFEQILAAIPGVERKQMYSPKERKTAVRMEMATKDVEQKLRALALVIRYAGLAVIDAACLERSQIVRKGKDYGIQLKSRQKTSKRESLQPIDNAIPPFVGKEVMAVLNGNPRYVFWNRDGRDSTNEVNEKRVVARYCQRWIRALLGCGWIPGRD